MIKSNVISGIVCFLFGAFVFWLSFSVPPVTLTDTLGGRFFPQIVAGLFMLASAGLVITGAMGIEIAGGTVSGEQATTRAAAPDPAPKVAQPRFGPGEKRLLAFVLTMLVYTLVLPLIGYIAASLITFALMIVIVGERRPLHVAVGTISITAILYLLFAVVFNMNVPEASLF